MSDIKIIGDSVISKNGDLILSFIPNWHPDLPADLVEEFDFMLNSLPIKITSTEAIDKYLLYVHKNSLPYLKHNKNRITPNKFYDREAYSNYKKSFQNRFKYDFPDAFNFFATRKILKNPLLSFRCEHTGYKIDSLTDRVNWVILLQQQYLDHIEELGIEVNEAKRDSWDRLCSNEYNVKHIHKKKDMGLKVR